ncbi:MAG: hypothetical protein K8J08_03540 [Thermoanaerobaculia bacterium]|nr:hypothetical protein [Thermoanaerobaculia bacterium]
MFSLTMAAVAAVGTAQGGLDFGDAPDSGVDPQWSFPTRLDDDGARHTIPGDPTLFLGSIVPPMTRRVSVDLAGHQVAGLAQMAAISASGRYVAFTSSSGNLVPGDTNGRRDVFIHDRYTGMVSRVSVDSLGLEGNSYSQDPAISAEGRWIVFRSEASNLVANDTNGSWDIFLHDRDSGTTSRVSVDSVGGEANDDSDSPSVSADGRWIAFSSVASNLVSGDTNGMSDVFLHDRVNGTTSRVSVDSLGIEGNGASEYPSVSGDGQFVAFQSVASNLVVDDTNGVSDVFVYEVLTGSTASASLEALGGQPSDGFSGDASLGADGQLIAFGSAATNLVANDTNGVTDVFVLDRLSGSMLRASVSSTGIEGNDGSYGISISADGRVVCFETHSSLVPDDTNLEFDVYVHDRTTGSTERVSVDSLGNEANGRSLYGCSISAEGDWVAFPSRASNLVPGDTNHNQDVFVHGLYQPIDAETDGVPVLGARGDDLGNDDEEGVVFPCCLRPLSSAELQARVSSPGYLNAWIDLNGDGDWQDSGEQILVDRPVLAGLNTVPFDIVATTPVPTTYARVRLTSYDTLGTLGVTGLASDGEVEDYVLSGTPLFASGFETGDTQDWTIAFPEVGGGD